MTDPEVLFEPDDLQRALFAVLFDVFSRTGRWPLFRYVNQTLRQTRGVDAQAVLESLPMIGVSPFGGGIYGASWALTAGGAVQPDSSVGLTLVGLHLAGWDQGVGGCLAVVRRLAALLGAWTPDPFASEDPVARWSHVIAGAGLPRWLESNGPVVRGVLDHEPPTWGMSGSDDWSIPLMRMHGFGRVSTIHEYVDVVARLFVEPKPVRLYDEPLVVGVDELPTRPLRIFVSYRRNDEPYAAGRLRERLVGEFGDGNVFFDVDSIVTGQDFRHAIAESLADIDVVIAVIGRNWNPDRLGDADDVVRAELQYAVDHRRLLIPVLLADATMPTAAELPTELTSLASANAARLRTDPDFAADATKLVTTLLRERDRLAVTQVRRSVALVDGDWYRMYRPGWPASFTHRCRLLASALRSRFSPLDSVTVHLLRQTKGNRLATDPLFTVVTSSATLGKTSDTRLAVAAVTVPPTTSRIVLVTGDDDLVPAVETLTAQGRHIVLVTDPANAATGLINAASSVVDLDALMPDR